MSTKVYEITFEQVTSGISTYTKEKVTAVSFARANAKAITDAAALNPAGEIFSIKKMLTIDADAP